MRLRLSRLFRRVGLVVLAMLLADAPARADFLDDLFGGGDSAPAQAAIQSRARAARRTVRDTYSIQVLDARKTARRSKTRSAAPATLEAADDKGHGPYVAGSRPQKAALCDASDPARADNSTAYLRDQTLRAGDSVVTPGSIIVFKGARACPHRASDFVSVARADLPKAKRNALATLEVTMRTPQRSFTLDAADHAKMAGRDTH